MADPKGQPEGEHIEELLSQLKGIFGHLSESEQEEAKQKVAPPPIPSPRESPPASEPSAVDPGANAPAPETVPFSEPAPDPASYFEPPVTPISDPPLPQADAIEVVPVTGPEPTFEPATPAETTPGISVPPGATLVRAVVFYPVGRANEAKMIADKVEKITPKFTKVAVVIHVEAMAVYDPKTDLKTAILPQVQDGIVKAVFLLMDKPLDDARRRGLVAELEPKGVYFQEIPFHQMEKKALYTDMLLGMVFFFDSQRPSGGQAG